MIEPEYLNLAKAIRALRRNPLFRHPDFGTVEVDDVIEHGEVLGAIGILSYLESYYGFRRDALAPGIRVKSGKSARNYWLERLRELFELEPLERIRLLTRSSGADTVEFACRIEFPDGPKFPDGMHVNTGRLHAIINPVLRPAFFSDAIPVWNGEAALRRAVEMNEPFPPGSYPPSAEEGK
jgi:hypothetical protein